jgi:hypothetical protein
MRLGNPMASVFLCSVRQKTPETEKEKSYCYLGLLITSPFSLAWSETLEILPGRKIRF